LQTLFVFNRTVGATGDAECDVEDGRGDQRDAG
jgi:hypothetical protein